ncbi:3-methyl-2-oxobutanoate hydroxymethyltransferase [Arcanobacterium hippocoleae]
MTKKVRIHHLKQMKNEKTPITMLTAYDAITSHIFDTAGTDMLLVGDSYGNVCLGYDSTVSVTLPDMVRATAAVARGVKRAFIVADLPFGTYEASTQEAVRSAVELVRAGAEAVKLEGGERQAHTIQAIVQAGIPVVGHIGYTPQSTNALGGVRVQGRGDAAEQVKADALAVEKAGAIAVVLEMVPADTAADITASLEIPTIGIGAGNQCDGQVLVWSDMAGMTDWRPSFAEIFGQVGQALTQAALEYNEAVRTRQFPDYQHSFEG